MITHEIRNIGPLLSVYLYTGEQYFFEYECFVIQMYSSYLTRWQ